MKPLLSHDNPLLKTNRLLATYSALLAPVVLLLLRLSMGYAMYESGHNHLMDVDGHHEIVDGHDVYVDGMVDRFKNWGVPYPRFNVYVSGITEYAGGILLMLGLATRWVSIPLAFNFIVAIISAGRGGITKAYHDYGLVSGAWDAIVNDTTFPFLTFALVMLAFGAGAISVDYLLGRKLFCDHKNTADAPLN